MEIFIFWFLFSIVCGIFASNKGRTGFGYFFLAMIISPLLCLLIVAVLSNLKDESRLASQPGPETHVKCPDCRELVLNDARKCKHCGCALIPQ